MFAFLIVARCETLHVLHSSRDTVSESIAAIKRFYVAEKTRTLLGALLLLFGSDGAHDLTRDGSSQVDDPISFLFSLFWKPLGTSFPTTRYASCEINEQGQAYFVFG